MKAEDLTIERYNRLVAETGLGPLIASYRERGYEILLQTGDSEDHTSRADIKQKRVWLSAKDLNNSQFSEAATFLSLVLHELGHSEAYERGLNHRDETLAWKIAGEISPVPLPPEWPRLRSYALTSYQLRVQGAPLDQDQAAAIQNGGRCPSCGTTELYGCTPFNSMSEDRHLSMPFLCRACDAGYAHVYHVVGAEPVFEHIVSWELPND